jgi:hypothetical protein
VAMSHNPLLDLTAALVPRASGSISNAVA